MYVETVHESMAGPDFAEYRGFLAGDVSMAYMAALREGLPQDGSVLRRRADFKELIPVLQPGGETMADYLAVELTRAFVLLGMEFLGRKMGAPQRALGDELKGKTCRSIRLRAERLVAFGSRPEAK